jgi:hypothetical protein
MSDPIKMGIGIASGVARSWPACKLSSVYLSAPINTNLPVIGMTR